VLALAGGIVCTGDAVLPGHAVMIDGDRIADVVHVAHVPHDAELVELDGAFVAPGLVDLQVNGGGDVLLEDEPTADGIAAIAGAHRALGTTALLPTLISPGNETIAAAAAAVGEARRGGVPGVLGLHVEGPFLNPLHAGAHPPGRIRPLTAADAELLAGLEVPALVTLAPETVAPEHLERLAAAGVRLAAGHSAADAAALDRAVAHGLRLVTHLFNAMSGFRAREPGLIGAALADDRVACGLIADGHHVAAPALRVALRTKPPGTLFLVSDAMPPVGGRRATFRLGQAELAAHDERRARPVGSAIPLAGGVRTLAALGVPVPEALRMASTVPADRFGAGGAVGRIAPGRRADLVVADGDGRLLRVVAGGRLL
jgi:N-acetylglucosamine-6-phosphate deacetylase